MPAAEATVQYLNRLIHMIMDQYRDKTSLFRWLAAELFPFYCILHQLVFETAWHPSNNLTAAMYSSVHGSDRRVVYHLDVTMEMRIPDNLTSSVSVHGNDATVPQVEHIASIQLHQEHKCHVGGRVQLQRFLWYSVTWPICTGSVQAMNVPSSLQYVQSRRFKKVPY